MGLGQPPELPILNLGQIKNLDQANSVQAVPGCLGQAGKGFLDGLVALMKADALAAGQPGNGGHGQDRHQRQQGAHEDHVGQGQDQGRQGAYRRLASVPGGQADIVDVVGGAGHDVARRLLVDGRAGQADDPQKETLAQIPLDHPAEGQHGRPAHGPQEGNPQGQGDNGPGKGQQPSAVGLPGGQQVDGFFDQLGAIQGQQLKAEDGRQPARHQPQVPPDILFNDCGRLHNGCIIKLSYSAPSEI